MINSELDEETRTIEMRLEHPQLYPIIEELLHFFAHLRNLLWRDLIVKRGSLNELKSHYIAEHGITARHFNSLAKELTAKESALEELKKDRLSKLRTGTKAIAKTLLKLEKRIKAAEAKLSAIASYRRQIKDWQAQGKLTPKKRRKPKMPASIKTQFTAVLKAEIAKARFIMHQKKRRQAILQQRLEHLMAAAAPAVCFGTKAYFRKQFHLDAHDLDSHETWLQGFRLRRSSQVFFVGSSDESAGNQTLQYDPLRQTVRLRLPAAPSFASFGTHLTLEHIVFPEHLRDEFYAALAQPGQDTRKGQKTRSPVSYRLLRRVNPHTGEKAYYLQACFSVPAPERSTRLGQGAIGVDLNADHIAVAATDPSGNLADSFVLPLDVKGVSTHRAKALMGDAVAIIVARAKQDGKPIVIEELDFEAKKKALREDQPKGQRRTLSAFAYAHFQQAIRSKARALGVELIAVNPAYTSLIGAYKFQGLSISTHEKAAFAIARRAQGYSEGLKVFHGTLPTHALMSERTLFEQKQKARHVWGFYSDHRQTIRSRLIEPYRRSFLSLKRATYLARGHPSLEQSYRVTRQRRVSEALHRASG